MKTRRLFVTALFLFAILFSSAAYAQFEGHITMNLYGEDNGQKEVSELNLYATADRIMIKGEESLEVMGKVSAGGLLIRNDMKDFIIMTEKDKALQATKTGIESLVEMLFSWSGESESSSSDTPEAEYEYTDRTKTILGYETTELIIRSTDDPENYLSVWLTPGIDINWGMLAEPWKGMPKDIDKELNGMSQDVIFKGKNFPLMIEVVEGDERKVVMDVKNVNRSSIAKAMVEVPSGVQLISLQEYIFSMMME
ncbi:DUF4412 domain-containing protein [Gracilimonas sediminicola]|uniref:DUF4412 domain-containing protein n=1 Tax=Gracilimonas sediminicola TaxID=2952158 RepID=A0A9X2L4G3_9BACT|nr:DUF4412 domain-containing protein [Gracilimonas sediminicola]MCP9292099.1 DUF4412 domain-containing protein [Gracilimonas sediminicola]